MRNSWRKKMQLEEEQEVVKGRGSSWRKRKRLQEKEVIGGGNGCRGRKKLEEEEAVAGGRRRRWLEEDVDGGRGSGRGGGTGSSQGGRKCLEKEAVGKGGNVWRRGKWSEIEEAI